MVKHRVEKYPDCVCRDMLLSNFYVDNLVKTHNTSEALLDLYQQAKSIMCEGNFFLGSCTYNSGVLTECMRADDSFVTHSSPD